MYTLTRDALRCSSSSSSSSSRNPPSSCKMKDEAIIQNRRRRHHFVRFVLITASAAAVNIAFFYGLPRQPRYSDLQRGAKYIRKLMFYNLRIFDTLRMNRKIFKLLID